MKRNGSFFTFCLRWIPLIYSTSISFFLCLGWILHMYTSSTSFFIGLFVPCYNSAVLKLAADSEDFRKIYGKHDWWERSLSKHQFLFVRFVNVGTALREWPRKGEALLLHLNPNQLLFIRFTLGSVSLRACDIAISDPIGVLKDMGMEFICILDDHVWFSVLC